MWPPAFKTLFNFEPPATDDEIRDDSLQFRAQAQRFPPRRPKANEAASTRRVEKTFAVAPRLVTRLTTNAPARNRRRRGRARPRKGRAGRYGSMAVGSRGN